MKKPEHGKKYWLETDAYDTGIGAVLIQEREQADIRQPVAYASKSLTPAQKNYSVTDKEGLAVVWGLKSFRHYFTWKQIFYSY